LYYRLLNVHHDQSLRSSSSNTQEYFVELTESVPSTLSIGLYSPGWPVKAFRNGIVTSVATFAQTFNAMGHKVTILAGQVAQGTSDESVYDMSEGARSRSIARRVVDPLWYHIAPGSAFRSAARHDLLRMIRRARAERGIELIDMEESFGWARWIVQDMPIPVCVRLHGPWFLNGSILGVPQDREYRRRVRDEGKAIQFAHAVSAPSRDVLDKVRAFYGLELSEAEVVPNPTLPVPASERWRYDRCDPQQVVFIGRFDRHKGGDLIIEAFRHVLEAVPEAKLRFVGPDPGCRADDGRTWNIESFIRDRIPGALESGRVEWLGPLPFPRLAEIRRQGMVTVICSRYETFSMTAVEAMALGCPTIAANTGGIPEILRDGVNGVLHQPGDTIEIASKIIQLLKNPAQAAELGRQAAADCQGQFYPDVVAQRLIHFYRRVVARPWDAR
jgi:glycosyltransferase involved in cell wall biosynthesis